MRRCVGSRSQPQGYGPEHRRFPSPILPYEKCGRRSLPIIHKAQVDIGSAHSYLGQSTLMLGNARKHVKSAQERAQNAILDELEDME